MRKLSKPSRWVLVFILTVLFALPVFAQFRSSIEGTITDPSGAVVPDAKVTLTNIDTGVSTIAQSNAEGLFRFPSLAPGRYKLTVSLQGFATITQENINLLAEEIRTIPLALKTGSSSDTITITAEVNAIQLAEAKIGSDISEREIRDLPLPGRNVVSVLSQTPGVTGIGNASTNANDTDIFSLVNNPQNSANGQRGEANAFYLDNTLATSNPDPGTYNLTPNPESVQELHVSVNDYSAEYGRSSSILIQAVTKSGTNDFHGSLFEYHQDNALTAHNFFVSQVPVSRRNEFGGSLGGPILKNRIFGFFSIDKKLSSTPGVLTGSVETPDFVNFMKSNFPNNLSTGLLTQFPATVANVTPGSLVTVQDLDPNCATTAPIPGIPCTLGLYETSNVGVSGFNDGLQWNSRVDVNFSRDRFYGNFYRKTPNIQGTNLRPAFSVVNNFAGITNYGNLDWTHTFSPTLVNDAAMGVTRISGLGVCTQCQVPSISGMGITAFGDGFAPAEFIQNDFQWRDLLSWNRGRHAMKFGFDIFRDQENDLFSGPTQRPGYVFLSGSPTGLNPIFDFANDTPTLEPGINFDLRTGALSQQSVGYRSTNLGFFGQDDWKVKPNLSVNLGLRWDFNTSPNEVAGRTASILLGSGSDLQEKITNASVGIVPSLFPKHGIAYFAPRLSFAWDPTKRGKLSIRGGMGVFYERAPNIFWSDATRANPPFIGSVNADTRSATAPQPVYGLCALAKTPFNCPIPPPDELPVGQNARGGALTNTSSIGGIDPAVKQAYTIARFLGVQYALTANWQVEANYTGSQSVHQYVRTDLNRCLGCYDDTGAPIRPNTFFSSINYGDNSGWAHSNSANFSVLHRFSQNFTMQATYSISKTISAVDAPGLGRDSLLSPVFDPYDKSAQRGPASFDTPKAFAMHGLWDLPRLKDQNALVRGVLGGWEFSGTVTLQSGYPFTVWDCNHSLDGNPDGSQGDCVLPNVASSELHKSCGKHGFVNGCLDPTAFSLPCALDGNVLSQSATTFTPCAQQGNAGRNSFRGPGYADVDSSLMKYFHIPWFVGHEGAKLQIRGEFYNLFNRVNLNNVSNDLALNAAGASTNATFGRATAAYFPRTIQVGARLEF
jgi:hypothetical protein